MHQRPSNHACWWRLTNSGRSAKQRHGNRRWTLRDVKVKPQYCTTKAVLVVFTSTTRKIYLSELKINHSNETLPFFSKPRYLGAMLDRSLTYRRHLESLRKKLTSRIAFLRLLAAALAGMLEQQRCEQSPYPGSLNSILLRSCLMQKCSHLPYLPCH